MFTSRLLSLELMASNSSINHRTCRTHRHYHLQQRHHHHCLIVYIFCLLLAINSNLCQHIDSEESNSLDCLPNDPNFPFCRPCACNLAGVASPENCDEPCECKPTVTGRFCDKCISGHVELNHDNPLGCTKCFCFGVTDSCRVTYWPSQLISNPLDWKITDLSSSYIVEPQQEGDLLVIADDDAPSSSSVPFYYWSAPDDYLGNMYAAYGRKVKISLSATVLRGDSAGNPVIGPDIILEGGQSESDKRPLRIGYNWKAIKFVRAERIKINRKIVLSEKNWFHVDDTGSQLPEPVTREEFATVLSDLKRFLIRAYFHTDQIEGSFYNVDVLIAASDSGLNTMNRITEECDCPEGYPKPSCGPGCEPGYRRVNNTLIGGVCAKCDCNGHAELCDPFTGECGECLHNTHGEHCEICLPGYYGQPWKGKSDDCKPCACPLTEPSNNFSPTCFAIDDGNDYICDACEWPTTGPKCNLCADGFIGDPSQPGSSCISVDLVPSATTTTTTPISITTVTATTTSTRSSTTETISTEETLASTNWPWTSQPTIPWWPIMTTTEQDQTEPITTTSCYPFEPIELSTMQTTTATTKTTTTTTAKSTTFLPPTTPFIPTPEKCASACSSLLHPEIWSMENSVNEIDIDEIFHIPYLLASLIRKEVTMRELFRQIGIRHFHGLALIDSFVSDEQQLNLTMETLVNRLTSLESSAITMISSTVKLLSSASSTSECVRSTQTSLTETINFLKNSVDSNTESNDILILWEQYLQQSASLLQQSSVIDLSSVIVNSTIEREQSFAFRKRTQLIAQSFSETSTISHRLNNLIQYLSSFHKLLEDQVYSKVNYTRQLCESVRQEMIKLQKEQINNQQRISNYSEILANSSKNLQDSREQIISQIPTLTSHVETMSLDLNRSILAVERVRSIYSRLNPFYQSVYVNSCSQRTSAELARINGAIDSYQRTMSFCQPYIDIPSNNNQLVVRINQASESASEALSSLSTLDIDQTSLSLTASAAKEQSSLLYQDIIEQSADIAAKISQGQSEVINRFSSASLILESFSQSHENLTSELKLLSKGTGARSRDTMQFSYILEIGVKNIERQIEEMSDSTIKGHLERVIEMREKWTNLEVRTVSYVNSVIGSVSAILDQRTKVSSKIDLLSNQRRSLKSSLVDLKKRLLLAKQKSAEIRLALAAEIGSTCIRSLPVESQPSSANSISLNYAVDSDDIRDTLILLTVNPIDGDFLAIDMVQRRIRFLWSFGGSASSYTILEHPLELKTSYDYLDEPIWYRIDAQRIGTIGTLNVRPIIGNSLVNSAPVKTLSTANYTILDVSNSHGLLIGGFPDSIEFSSFPFPVPAYINNYEKMKGFRGCLSDLIFDEKHIGLWNFNYSSSGCTGCSKTSPEPWDYEVFHFNGKSSYAVLDQIPRYDNRNYQVVMVMATFDENSLIFFCSDSETGNYIAIHLVDGSLSFSFRDGPRNWLKLITTGKYNNGKWFRVSAARSESKAMLTVEEETIEGEIEKSDSPDLSDCKVHFGGVPPNFTVDQWSSQSFKPFLGCMKDVQIDSTPINLLDGETFGLSTGCSDSLLPRSVQFLGDGSYLQLKAIPLRDNDYFSLTFKSNNNQKDCILLMATFKSNRANREFQYYSLAIIGGSLEARFNPGSGEVLLISEVTVNDSQFHTVTINKRNRRVWMTVDDYDVKPGKLGPGRNIGFTSDHGLYLGGIPSTSTEWSKILGTNTSLEGVIRDFIFDGKVIRFNQYVTGERIEIGRGI